MENRHVTIPLGIVLRKTPGVTRWAKWAWKAVAVLPGAPAADWRELRREGETVEYHAGTLPLTLWRTDTEAYLVALSATPPVVWVVMRNPVGAASAEHRPDLLLVTASAYEAQDYMDNGEDIVEQVPMPPGLIAWVREFVDTHHVEDPFVKRRRDRARIDGKEDGRGDPRIRQMTDVYRAPARRKGIDE